MEKVPSYVLIIDGGNYCSTQETVTSTRLNQGEFVDAVKVVNELERIVGCKFTTKFYFQGTQSKRPNEFHRALAQPPPHGPHFNVEIFGKKRQWGLNANNVRNEIYVEEGVDVAVATKIIECAYGIGKEEQSDKIVVITGDGDMLKAIECADAKRRNTVRVVSARQSLSASLNSFVLIDPETSNAVYLDELMHRCVSGNNRSGGNGSSSDYGMDSRNTSLPRADLIPTGLLPEPHFHQGSNNFNRGDYNTRRGGGGGGGGSRNHNQQQLTQQKPPKETRGARFARVRAEQQTVVAANANEILRTEDVAAMIDRSGNASSDVMGDVDFQGFKTVSKLKRKLRKQLEGGKEQLSDIDEDDQYDHPNNHKLPHTSSSSATAAAASGVVGLVKPGVHTVVGGGGSSSASGAVGGFAQQVGLSFGAGMVAIPDINMDSDSDVNYQSDLSDAVVPPEMSHLSKNQRKKLRRKMRKENLAREQAAAALGMRPIGAKAGERVTVDLVDDEEGGFPALTIHGVNGGNSGGGGRGDVISID